jgi:DedD protein
MPMPPTDPESSLDSQLELKKRARRRLVGAAALALLAAIVLPMIMDHEPRPSSSDVQIRIPSPDAKPVTRPAAQPEARPAEKVPEKPVVEKVAEPVPVAAPEPPAKPEKVEKVEKAADKPAAKAAGGAAAGAAEEARALAALAGAPLSQQWVVQLGAYQSDANVTLLLGKLKEMAVPAYTEKFESPQGRRTRVRAGPFKSREAAEAAQARIRKIGVDGPVAAK